MKQTVTLCDVCRSVPARTYVIMALGDRAGEYVADICGPMCLVHWAARVWDGRETPHAADEETLRRALFPGSAENPFNAYWSAREC
jgi:hypothetical protein